jgi:hypothetical protein
MSKSLMQGHAAWVWIDLNGHGPRWHLAVPVEREDWADVAEDDNGTCRFQALFPLYDDYRCEVEELIGCPQRVVRYPQTPPTEGEINSAKIAEEDHFGPEPEGLPR